MQRRQFLALVGLTAFTARMGWGAAQGKRKVSPLQGPVVVDPSMVRVPEGFSPEMRDQMVLRVWELQLALRSRTVPFSAVVEQPGLAIYTRAVNRVTEVAFAGDVEWVGTRYGIKRVDRRRKELQLYTREDGLPGLNVLKLVGDAREAFALVQCPDGATAFCHLPAGQDTWKVLHERARSTTPYFSNEERLGEDCLVLNGDVVVYVPGHLVAREEMSAPYYVYQRPARKLVAGTWDPAVMADHPRLGITCAFLTRGQLWLGSTIGLLALSLEGKSEVPSWRRFLPEKAIVEGVALPEQRLALRMAPRGSY